MSKPKVSVSQINIIAKNYDATLRFYLMVGLDRYCQLNFMKQRDSQLRQEESASRHVVD